MSVNFNFCLFFSFSLIFRTLFINFSIHKLAFGIANDYENGQIFKFTLIFIKNFLAQYTSSSPERYFLTTLQSFGEIGLKLTSNIPETRITFHNEWRFFGIGMEIFPTICIWLFNTKISWLYLIYVWLSFNAKNSILYWKLKVCPY